MPLYLRILALVLLCSQSSWPVAQHAALSVPAKTGYWNPLTDFSQAAADDSGFNLTIYTADREKMPAEPSNGNHRTPPKALTSERQHYQFDPEAIASTSTNRIPLTQAERQWLAENPVIPIGGESNWPPYDFVDEQSNHTGVAADLLELMGKRLGVHFEVDASLDWEAMLDQLRSGKLYAACAIAPTPSRNKDFLFTTPYALSPTGVITRNDNNSIKTLSDLTDKRIAIPAGFADIELLQNRLPDFTLVKVDSLYESLQAVQQGKADAAFGSTEVAAYLMDQNKLKNLKVSIKNVPMRGNELRFGINRNQPLLASILQKALNSIEPEEINVILNRWITILDLSQITYSGIILTAKEKAWLARHPAVRFTGDPNWLPFEGFNEQGEFIGIISELLTLIESRAGITFRRIPSSSWLNAIAMANNNEVDVLSDDPHSQTTRNSLRFTDPFLTYPLGIFMRDEQNQFIHDLYKIADKRIVVIEDYGYLTKLYDLYPDITFNYVKNVQEALLAVSTGKADAFIASFNLGSYHINQMGLNNLRLAGQVAAKLEVSLGVRKDMPELFNILNKTIATLTPSEKFQITERWMHEKYVQHVDYTLLKRFVAGAAVLFLLILFWNRLLKKQVEKRTASLLKSQESLSRAESIAHLGHWQWDFSTDHVSWSDEVYRLFGYPPQSIKLTGNLFAKHLHPDDHSIVGKAAQQARSGSHTTEVAFRIIRKDNATRFVDVQAEPVINNHNVTGLFGTIQDKTVQQKTELALRRGEERYRRFVETNTAGILNAEYRPPIPTSLPAEEQIALFFKNSYTTEVNSVLAKQLGYSSPEDCRGKNLSFHIDASDPDNTSNMLSYIHSGYRASGLLLHVKDLQGNDLYFLNNAQGIVEKDLLKSTWLSLIDVTQRRQSELALRTSEEKFSKAFEFSPDPMSISKLRDARFQYVNRSFEKISGYRKDEVLGRTPREINLWSDPADEIKLRRLMHQRAEIRELNMTFYTKQGKKRFTQLSGGVFHIGDEPYLILEIRDLTEKIGLERKTRQQELQLIQANKMTALGTLLSGVGHEINNPNNLVMMNGQILQDAWPDISRAIEHYHKDNPAWQLAGLPYEEMKNSLPDIIMDIKDGAQRIQTIVGTLRDFARPGQANVKKEYQINDAVQRALPMLRHLIQRNTNHFQLVLADGLPTVTGNPQKIEQVIINLVINALESLPDREARLTLSTRDNPAEKMLEVEVADEGIGMSQNQLKKIREPFFTTKLDTGGTGLGLAISDSLIREQGGYLSFTSQLGKGTQVIIHLPVSNQAVKT